MSVLAHNNVLQDTIQHWRKITPVIHEPQNETDYKQLSALLDTLLDIVGEDESCDLIGLVDVISHMISMYDEAHYQSSLSGSGIDALKFLMVQHGLKQVDLKYEIGSQGVVSEVLNGQRQLNTTQIKKLSERFKVSPATFLV